jgi:hypothetical protein
VVDTVTNKLGRDMAVMAIAYQKTLPSVCLVTGSKTSTKYFNPRSLQLQPLELHKIL